MSGAPGGRARPKIRREGRIPPGFGDGVARARGILSLFSEGPAEGDGGVELGEGGSGEGDAEFAGEVGHVGRGDLAVGDEHGCGADDVGGAQGLVGDEGGEQQGAVEIHHEHVAHEVGGDDVEHVGLLAGGIDPEGLGMDGGEEVFEFHRSTGGWGWTGAGSGGFVGGGQILALVEADVIEQVLDFEGNVDVLDEEGGGRLELDGGEVEDALDAGGGELVENAGGGAFGDGEDGDMDILFLDEGRELTDGQDGDGGGGIDAGRVVVESGDHLDVLVGEARVVHEGGSDLAATHDDDALEDVRSKDGVEALEQDIDGIAAALVADGELGEGEILADEGGGDAGRVTQIVGKHPREAEGFEFEQYVFVSDKALNHLFLSYGILFLHINAPMI